MSDSMGCVIEFFNADSKGEISRISNTNGFKTKGDDVMARVAQAAG